MKIVSLGIKRVSYPDLILDWLFLDCGALSTAESSSLADGSNLEPADDGRVDSSERKVGDKVRGRGWYSSFLARFVALFVEVWK